MKLILPEKPDYPEKIDNIDAYPTLEPCGFFLDMSKTFIV